MNFDELVVMKLFRYKTAGLTITMALLVTINFVFANHTSH